MLNSSFYAYFKVQTSSGGLPTRRALPSLRSMFRRRAGRLTPEEAAAIALGITKPPRGDTRVSQRSRFVPKTLLPTSSVVNRRPNVALVETTYNELKERERIRHEELVHEDFVNRNAAFEVDA